MIDVLKFVQGAVARKDFVPALQHFRICNGLIKACNGTLSLCSPINVDLDVAPRATQFVAAIEACSEEVVLGLTDTGRLMVRSGKFKTFVDTIEPTSFPPHEPEGERVTLDASLKPALRYLEPFIAEDASRPWACGILLDNQSAFATNNVVLQEYWLGFQFPCRVNVPAAAIRELLRIDADPVELQMSGKRLTFHFADKRWLTTNLYETDWPETEPLLSRESKQAPFPKDFFEALERLAPFADDLGRVYFFGDRMSTSASPDDSGTTVELPDLPDKGCFNIKQLLRLREVAQTIDFASYPLPSIFYGGAARGLLVGFNS